LNRLNFSTHMSLAQAGVSVAVALICLVAAALFWAPKIGKRHTPRLVVLLVLTGSVGLVGTKLGNWVHTASSSINDATGRAIGQFLGVSLAGAISVILAFAVAYTLAIEFKEKKIGNRTLGAAGLTPMLVASIPGQVGSLLVSGIAMVAGLVSWPIAAGLGWM
jgi:hypothetical protein